MKINQHVLHKKIFLVLVVFFLAFAITGCQAESSEPLTATNLMANFVAETREAIELDDCFIMAKAEFSINLFQNSIASNYNTLISPTSVMLALAMLQNGASGQTLSQMEQVLGNNLSVAQLNHLLYSFVNGLYSGDNSTLDIANSIWIGEGRINVLPPFLQTNANYFNACAFEAPFDHNTVRDINDWVSQNTDGMIENFIEDIDPFTIMILINTLLFDARWATIYREDEIRTRNFYAFNGITQRVRFMSSDEDIFISDNYATGFMKPYYGGHYSFLALLPNEDICIFDYINSLTGASFINMIENATRDFVIAGLPQFEFDFETRLKYPLIDMGIVDAFDDKVADFSLLGERLIVSPFANIHIFDVIHATSITVNAWGTRAGAATAIEINGAAEALFITLNRPFVFAIIDNNTNLPIFIGTVLEI